MTNNQVIISPNMVFQNEISECGLACICMFSESLGISCELGFLRERFPVTSSGASMMDLVNIFNEINIPTLPVKFDVNTVNELPLPAIIHFGGNHYVFISEKKGSYVHIYNPATGEAVVTIDSLKEYFTGYAIILDRSKFIAQEENEKTKKKNSFLVELKIPNLKRIFLGSVIVGLLGFITPLLFSKVIDGRNDINSQIFFLFAIVIFCVLISSILEISLSKLSIKQTSSVARSYLPGIFGQLISKKMSWFELKDASDINQRLSSLSRVIIKRGSLVNTLAISLFTAVISVLIMFVLHPLLGSIALIVMFLYGFISYFFSQKRDSIYHALEIASGDLNEFSYETINNIGVIKSADLFNERRAKFAGKSEYVINKMNEIQWLSAKQNTCYKLLANLENICMLAIALYLFSIETLTVGELFAFAMFKQIALGSVTDYYFTKITARENAVIEARAKELFLNEQDLKSSSTKIKKFRSISCEKVTFSYLSKIVFCFSQLHIKQGDKIAVMGVSGSGKSSLMKMLAGWNNPTEGTLLIDGDSYEWQNLQQISFYLRPEDTLLHSTVLDNIILFGDRKKSIQADKIIDMLQLKECIDSLPHRYHTQVSHNNPLLSAGQQQRILLARALCSDKALVLLDEPTANLDKNVAEKAINAILVSDKTAIVSLHDKDFLHMFDKVIEIRDGELSFSNGYDYDANGNKK